MESLTHTLGSIKNTVVNAFSNTSPTSTLSRSEVLGLEENERTRRLAQVAQARVDKENAANVSVLIKTQRFPVFRGNVSKGYKRVTTKFEEEERRRRLTNKAESALRRANANKTARMIQGLGWPFYRANSGPEYIVMDHTKLLEEEEREWRTTDAYWAPSARHNAAMVANILRWNNFQKNPRAGFRRYTHLLEEKERTYRLGADVFTNAMGNAYEEAGLIRHMGPPYYVQQQTAKRDFTEVHKLEEAERKRRMRNPSEQQLAHELAGAVSGHLHRESELEEQERGRRLIDIGEQKLAKQNAKQVSLMVRESSSNKIGTKGPMWLGISRNSMRALEEIERTRRIRDIEGQCYAQQQSKRVADLLIAGLSNSTKPGFISLEEEERQSRILDRAQQQLAIKNARKVSGLLARHFLMSSTSKSFALAMEESERAHRLQDREQQRLSKDNAKKVSSLVSSLSAAPLTQARELPTYGTTTAPASTTVSIPTAPTFAAPTAAHKELPRSSTLPSLPLQKELPRSNTLPYLPNQAPTALPAGSQRSSGEYTRPESPLIAAAPVSRSVPIQQAPIAPTPLSSSPTFQPFVLPTTSANVPVAPLASAPTTMPATISLPRQPSYTSVPVDSLATGQPLILGERERKSLIKQADRHNRKSEKEVRKAEQAMLKAEKLHQKGRDEKAQKLESKAEKFMQTAEHERRWATGLQGELHPSSPAPATM